MPAFLGGMHLRGPGSPWWLAHIKGTVNDDSIEFFYMKGLLQGVFPEKAKKEGISEGGVADPRTAG